MGKRKPLASVFMTDMGNTNHALYRRLDRLRDIQKVKPDFNYREHHFLQFDIDRAIKTLEEMKTIGVGN